jgi:hypothetical protein
LPRRAPEMMTPRGAPNRVTALPPALTAVTPTIWFRRPLIADVAGSASPVTVASTANVRADHSIVAVPPPARWRENFPAFPACAGAEVVAAGGGAVVVGLVVELAVVEGFESVVPGTVSIPAAGLAEVETAKVAA